MMSNLLNSRQTCRWQSFTRALLLGLSICSVALFCFAIYARPTDWFSQDKELAQMRNAMTINLTSVAVLMRVGWIDDGTWFL